MKRGMGLLAALLALGLCGTVVRAQDQNKTAPAPTIASVLDQQLKIVEGEFVSAAEAMPEDKYSFAPTAGEFKGVRTFAEQVRHVGDANYQFYSRILGQTAPSNPGENGPGSVKTKEEILKYLRDSFALGHRAIATITAENAAAPLIDTSGKPLQGPFSTRLALADIGCWHSFDHYGQMVEYLRMNGIVPPASRPQPPAAKK
jgi:uncharacterized damage-inducible protein DinB